MTKTKESFKSQIAKDAFAKVQNIGKNKKKKKKLKNRLDSRAANAVNWHLEREKKETEIEECKDQIKKLQEKCAELESQKQI